MLATYEFYLLLFSASRGKDSLATLEGWGKKVSWEIKNELYILRKAEIYGDKFYAKISATVIQDLELALRLQKHIVKGKPLFYLFPQCFSENWNRSWLKSNQALFFRIRYTAYSSWPTAEIEQNFHSLNPRGTFTWHSC